MTVGSLAVHTGGKSEDGRWHPFPRVQGKPMTVRGPVGKISTL